jgi:nucleoside-diphosphate-sugar epimerase
MNALDHAKEHGCVRFLFISSVDVYGKSYDTGRLSEDDLGCLDMLYPRNAYSNGKRSAETLCSLYFNGYGLQTVIARPFQIYGPGMSLSDGRLHGNLIGQIKDTGRITLKSDGMAKRSFMYIRDAAEALFSILLKGFPGGAYNVCDEQSEATVLELANLYKKIANCNVDVLFENKYLDSAEVKEALPCVLGSSKKLRTLGWRPQTTLSDGARMTYEHFLKGDMKNAIHQTIQGRSL